ncbi:hypothetical protein [Xanthomonas phaseoli]|uniref:Uncharacterized protein n=1 Tax=Xanthomonas manihotis TaxID=43353 RepID=A0A8I1XJQ8_XANMN|nr:hypothetical protein [Xanthomonas phaseoli]KUF23920.1 hypothetical protein AO826_11275 [Xanthomonas phaseoli pv. manihotis]MBO9718722.1 hypothetical protein [Xanthomonas phaseoli pv. manihotis]MBO9753967.1 hypothetical protein [Xanthomonas phaseoli pv. manihotis]MBO9759203.1 hypothetical protein [Xanthomonas phaseoli pv. manihotis]MBO9765871.1 hypothetical protein [Xanthomonas phaseoli pv. manihotis]
MSNEPKQAHVSHSRRLALRTALLGSTARIRADAAGNDARPSSARRAKVAFDAAQLTLCMLVFEGFQLLDVFGPRRCSAILKETVPSPGMAATVLTRIRVRAGD